MLLAALTTLTAAGLPAAASADRIRGDATGNVLTGTDGRDVIRARAGNDIVDGRAGRDLIRGQDGDDALAGGTGRDALSGNGGNDIIDGGSGRDVLNGGAGNDRLTADGRDRVLGRSGDDLITLTIVQGARFRVSCGTGTDRLVLHVKRRRAVGGGSLRKRVRACEKVVVRSAAGSSGDRARPAPAKPAPPAAAAPPAGPAGPDDPSQKIVGMTHFGHSGPAAIRTVRSIGVTHDRQVFDPDRGFAYADQKFDADADGGVTILPTLDTHQQLSTIDRGAWASFAAEFAARYGPGGTFWRGRADGHLAPTHIEIFNEPYGRWYYSKVEPDAFAHLYVAMADAMRKANPNVRFLLPIETLVNLGGGDVSWTAELFKAEPGIASRVDGLAIHPYGSYAPGADDRYTYWETRRDHAEFARYGGPKPLWITEVGQCTAAGATDAAKCVNEAQAAEAMRFYVNDLRSTPFIKALFVFTFKDGSSGNAGGDSYGMFRADGTTAKPAFGALRDALAAR